MQQLIRTDAGWVLIKGMRLVKYGKSLSFQRYDEDGWPLEESGWLEQDESRTIADALTDIGLDGADAEHTAAAILRDWDPRWASVVPQEYRGPALTVGTVFALAFLGVLALGALIVWLITRVG